MSDLVSAEANIHSLNQQVKELNSLESISRVRESYNSALSQATQRHREEKAKFDEQFHQAQEKIESKVIMW